MSSSRSTQPQRVARPAARYRPGKAPIHAGDAYSSDEDNGKGSKERQNDRPDNADIGTSDLLRRQKDDGGAQRRTAGVVLQTGDGPLRKPFAATGAPRLEIGAGIKAPEGGNADDAFESSEYETDTDDEAEEAAPAGPVFRKPGQAIAPASASQPVANDSSEYESDSEDDESSQPSEEEKPIPKPIFKSKNARSAAGTDTTSGGEKVNDGDDAEKIARQSAEERRKQSHLLVAHTVERELAERQAREAKPDVDDTDGLDPDAEFAAWRLRELARIERERKAIAEREEVKEEIERRRAMPEEQRLAEDMARAEQSRKNKKKGDMGFMEKYYHKGSFYQDLDILKKRDYTQATENAVDKKLLPKIMQVRDYGKASRSKWTHLSNEDTTRRQEDARFKGISQQFMGEQDRGRSDQGCYICGGPHLRRECPEQRTGPSGPRYNDTGPGRGANNIPVAPRDGSRDNRTDRREQSRGDRRLDDDRPYGKRRRSRSPGRITSIF